MAAFVEVGYNMLEYVAQLYNSFNIPGFSFTPWQFVLLCFQLFVIAVIFGVYLK